MLRSQERSTAPFYMPMKTLPDSPVKSPLATRRCHRSVARGRFSTFVSIAVVVSIVLLVIGSLVAASALFVRDWFFD